MMLERLVQRFALLIITASLALSSFDLSPAAEGLLKGLKYKNIHILCSPGADENIL
jgi:hypothetical protein